MKELVVHRASGPGWLEPGKTVAVQPCARCGVILHEFDTKNPPMTVMVDPSEEPTTYGWWAEDAQVAEVWIDGAVAEPRMHFIVDDDQLLVSSEDVRLCDPESVPDRSRTVWELPPWNRSS